LQRRCDTPSLTFPPWLESLPDPRCAGKVIYGKRLCIWSALSIFIMNLGSRRQFDREAEADDQGVFLKNLNLLAGTDSLDIPHNDTVADYLSVLPYEALEPILALMARRLIAMRALEFARMFGRYMVAIDATGMGSYSQRHCEHCLTQQRDGKTIYYHLVLEAKLVTPDGLVFSVASEFIENANPTDSRQDCERKAMVRLMEKLKRQLPRLRICLLTDALHANNTVFDLCERFHWDWIITFKPGSLPRAWGEFCLLKAMTTENAVETRVDDRYQRLSWVGHLEHEGRRFSAFDCLTYNDKHEVQYFAWCTNVRVDSNTVSILANKGGRTRWKIENQGFDIQKNHGYGLEHAYSTNENGSKNFYLLLQIAHALVQLLVRGRLAKAFKSTIRTFKNFFRRMSQSLLSRVIPPEALDVKLASAIQIRLNTS